MDLLEREPELERLGDLLDRARKGEGGLVLVEGEAGIGKTVLLGAGQAAAVERGYEVLSATGGELEQEFAWGVARQLYEPALARADASAREQLLAGAAGLAAPMLGLHEPTSAPRPSQAATLTVNHGLYWLTANLADERPLLVLVDDAHWADPATLLFLNYLGRRLEALPVLAALGLRPAEPGAPGELLETLAGLETSVRIDLDALSERATSVVVDRAIGGGSDERFQRACHEATGGNPFLLRELLRELRSEKLEANAAAVERVERLGPGSIARSVLGRLGAMWPEALQLAQAVAVLGTEADLRHAAAIAEIDERAAGTAADALADARILTEGRPVRFAHPILRHAVYQDLPEGRRAVDHLRAARLLDADGTDPDRIAAHLLATERAGDEWVVERLRETARRDLAAGAPGAAARLLRRALAEPPAQPLRAEVLLELGLAAEGANEIDEAIGSLREAHAAAGTPEQRAGIALELGRVLAFSEVHAAESAEVFVAALAEVGDVDTPLRWQLEALRLLLSAASPEAREELPAVLERLEAEFDRLSPVAQQILGATLSAERVVSGHSAAHVAELARAALRKGELLQQLGPEPPFFVACLTLVDTGHLDEARSELDAAVALSRRLGSPPALAVSLASRSVAQWRQGSLHGAESDALLALELVGDAEWVIPHYFALPSLVSVYIAFGRVDEAAAALDARSAIMPGESDLRQRIRAAEADVLLARGDARGALGLLHRCQAWLSERTPPSNGLPPVPWRSLAATAHALLEEREEALELARAEVDLARGFGDPIKLGAALRTLGQVDTGERAIAPLTESVDILASSRARLEHAAAMVELGSAQRRIGNRREARATLAEGMDLAHHCGATGLVGRARDELIRDGARPRRHVLTGVDALTPSERRVAEMAASGMTNREIAQALFVTQKTVEVHLSHSYQKLDISSRRDLARALSDVVQA